MKRSKVGRIVACVRAQAFVAGLFASCAPAAVEYSVTAILPAGQVSSVAQGINNAGQVVGYAQDNSSRITAFVYDNGVITMLAPLSGGTDSDAFAINDAGRIVGEASTAGNSKLRAALWTNPTAPANLGSLGTTSRARAINSSGQIVGSSLTNGNFQTAHAFFSDGTTMTDLGTLGGTYSEATAINDSGQIVGTVTTSGRPRAFLLSNGTQTDLGTLGGITAEAFSINNSGQVVGRSTVGRNRRAFLYENGSMIELGATALYTQSVAADINDNGDVVGSLYNGTGESHAFIYSGGQIRDLNALIDADSGWDLQEALAINNTGLIVGYGRNTTDPSVVAFLLTPIPEPNLSMMIPAAIAYLVQRRSRHFR